MKNYQYRTGAYLRLSKGDGDVDGTVKGESNSISNQRLLIDRFLQENPEFYLVETYIDDGYSGTNFERPAMQKLLDDIDQGKIDCVLVKDLSRFGRERIETGTLILKTFKEKGIRFIAINDHYDSLTANSSEKHLVMPIKSLTNDFYSMDISNKIRASQSVKREKGEFIGSYAPFGYVKDPENKNHLIIDPEAAKVVQQIFAKYIAGKSANGIAEELKAAGVLTPNYYKKSKDPTYKTNNKKPGKCNWSAKQILRILENETYIGSVVQGRVSKVSYKVDKLIEKPKEEWTIVPRMHEPIISESDFQIVQSLMERPMLKGKGQDEVYPFAGLIFCGDCGMPMIRRLRRYPKSMTIEYLCNGYIKGQGCPSHRIREEDLHRIVKSSVNYMMYQLCQYSQLAENLKDLSVTEEEAVHQNQELQRLKEEMSRIELLRQGLYDDVQEGLLSEEMFHRLNRQYAEQINSINSAMQNREKMIRDLYEKGLSASKLLEQFRVYPHVEKLDRVLLVTLIDRILIYDDGRIDIVYRHGSQMEVLDDIVKANEEKGALKDGKNEK